MFGGRVVRLRRGAFEDMTAYSADVAGQARQFAAEGAGMVHVVDLAAARSGRRDPHLGEVLHRASVRYQLGGGIRTAADASSALAAGADRVVMGTAAVWNPGVVDETLEAVGTDALVVALDVKAGMARGAGWQDGGAPLRDVAARLSRQGVIRCVVTGIDRDGVMSGPDVDIVRIVQDAAPEMAIIASGGVASADHVAALADSGCEAAIVGRALYEGRLTLGDAIAAGA